MPTRNASATWNGDLKAGNGTVKLGSGAYEGKYSFSSRFEEGTGTNPEELIAAALAGCYSMQLSAELGGQGAPAESVRTEGRAQLLKEGDGFAIKKIELVTRARVPGIDEDTFQQAVQAAKEDCLVSKALAGVAEITVDATLES